MKTLVIVAVLAYVLVGIPAMLVLGRIIRAGNEHLDRPQWPGGPI